MIPLRPTLCPEFVPMFDREPERLPKDARQLHRLQLFLPASGLFRQIAVMPVPKMPSQIIHRKRNIKLVRRRHRSQSDREASDLSDKFRRHSSGGNAALQYFAEKGEQLIDRKSVV